MMLRRLLILFTLFALLGLAPRAASAQTCSASASALNFGNVSPIRLGAVPATGTITVSCTWPDISLTPTVLVCLNLGGTSPRALTNGTSQLQYDIYQDAGHTVLWGSAALGTTPITVTLVRPGNTTTATATVTFYGQVAGNQPTVPTVANTNTAYSQTLSQTSLGYSFYLLLAPTCASLASSGSFPFTATATVVNDCTITATNIAFSATSVLNTTLDATGTVTARCTNGDAFRIALNGGSTGNVAARKMQGTGGAVNYQLYTDSARTTPWGDGTAGTAAVTGTGTGNPAAFTMYGRVPAQTTPAPGSYSDTITATIYF